MLWFVIASSFAFELSQGVASVLQTAIFLIRFRDAGDDVPFLKRIIREHITVVRN